MTDSLHGAAVPQAALPIDPVRAAAGAHEHGGEVSGVSFRALLEQLEQSAARLSEQSQRELSRESLPAAVADARTSLEQVLTLKDRLLEEWRAAQRRGQA